MASFEATPAGVADRPRGRQLATGVARECIFLMYKHSGAIGSNPGDVCKQSGIARHDPQPSGQHTGCWSMEFWCVTLADTPKCVRMSNARLMKWCARPAYAVKYVHMSNVRLINWCRRHANGHNFAQMVFFEHLKWCMSHVNAYKSSRMSFFEHLKWRPRHVNAHESSQVSFFYHLKWCA